MQSTYVRTVTSWLQRGNPAAHAGNTMNVRRHVRGVLWLVVFIEARAPSPWIDRAGGDDGSIPTTTPPVQHHQPPPAKKMICCCCCCCCCASSSSRSSNSTSAIPTASREPLGRLRESQCCCCCNRIYHTRCYVFWHDYCCIYQVHMYEGFFSTGSVARRLSAAYENRIDPAAAAACCCL